MKRRDVVLALTSYVMAAAMVMKVASLQLHSVAVGGLDARARAAKEQQVPQYQRADYEDVAQHSAHISLSTRGVARAARFDLMRFDAI